MNELDRLDSPAIGRKIKHLMHEDRNTLIAILSGTRRENWPQLATGYLIALGQTEQADRQPTIPGVLYVWDQLVKEHNATQHSDRSPDFDRKSRAVG